MGWYFPFPIRLRHVFPVRHGDGNIPPPPPTSAPILGVRISLAVLRGKRVDGFEGVGAHWRGNERGAWVGEGGGFREELESLIQEQLRKGEDSGNLRALRHIVDFISSGGGSPLALPTSPP
ncbi:hypothetical protein chiPu_0023894, partial [Chiloscyllium punctatum]|nr:hypothetical protein [Chiloscyllium punctatum]